MENKGIIISGGELNSANLAVGDNSKIELAKVIPSTRKDTPHKTFAMVENLKQLIAQGRIASAIQEILLHSKDSGNKTALNAAIMLSSSWTQLEMQESMALITHDQAKIDRAKVVNALLQLIDNEINQ
jgi:hypothetical protein